MTLATFAAGCFWHVQAAFDELPETKTTVGYMGGSLKNPSYRQVCTDTTGHAEVCQVEFDKRKVSYQHLFKAFWKCHDPTQLNRQGPDVGKQYRSAIFYHSPQQKKEAGQSLKEEQKKHLQPIVTQIIPATEFYPAEEYHQKYFQKHGKGCSI